MLKNYKTRHKTVAEVQKGIERAWERDIKISIGRKGRNEEGIREADRVARRWATNRDIEAEEGRLTLNNNKTKKKDIT